MNHIESIKETDMYNIISVVKLISLIFCLIIPYRQFFTNQYADMFNKNDYYNVVSVGIFTAVIIIIYFLWCFFSIKIFKFKHIRTIQIVENFIFIGVLSFLLIMSKANTSQYKFLFIFIIITSTIQLGKKHGMTMAVVSSLVILSIDLIYCTDSAVNLYFENDLILAGVFILTAWPLGHYVKIENQNINMKNIQLKELNDKLNKKDIQRKYIESILLRNEYCYNLLIENSIDAIFLHRNEELIFANESAAKLLGMKDVHKLSGKSILDFTPSKDKDKLKSTFSQIYNQKNSKTIFEEKLIDEDGQVIIMQNTSTYLIYEGKPTILSILRNITSEKQVEKLQKDVEKNIELLNKTRELNKLIIEVFSNISHELKTPLNVIFSAVQVLGLHNKDKEDKKRSEYLKVMKQNCYRLMRLINNILDMTKLESGFLKLHPRNLNIVSVVEEITLSVAPYVESKEVNLTFDTDVEEKIMCFDPDKIERIVLNIISNAIKFTNPGGNIFVNIMDKKDDIVISVKDTGTGIPKDKMNVIFERFGQVDKTFRRDCEGSGIGLCIVKSFIEMHGGKIEVNSEFGKGSEFIITLPTKYLQSEDSKEISYYEANIERINIEFSDIYFDLK